jgi:peptidoglycan/LPS O-acetylase OafA/YrhL
MFVVKNVPAWQHVVSQVLFVQNYWEILLPHTWSLAVEEHFYIVLPFLLCAIRGRDAARPFAPMTWVCAAIVLGCLVLRFLTPWAGHIVWSTHVYPTHLRCDGLFLGVWLSWLHHFHGEKLAAFVARWRVPLVIAGTILALPPFFVPIESTRWMHTVGFTMLSAGAACWLLVAVHREGRQGVLAWIGFYSYSIYLWHYVMSTLGMKYLSPADASPLVQLPIYIGGSLLAGVLASKIVEMPILRLRDRLFPSRSQ